MLGVRMIAALTRAILHAGDTAGEIDDELRVEWR